MRRAAPVLLVLAIAALLAWHVVYTQVVVSRLREEASRSGRMYARVFRALADTTESDGTAALLDLSRHIREMGVPVIVTGPRGRPTAAANLPFDVPLDDPRVASYVSTLDDENPPVEEPGVGTVHFGNTPLVGGLRVIPLLQAATLALLLAVAFYAVRAQLRGDRERVWAGMARESAHQLGTPLSSLSGWIELLDDGDRGDLAQRAVTNMRADLERLERVAHRFERIGQPPRREPVDVGEIAERVATYFRARVPKLKHAVTIESQTDDGAHVVSGDAVLLEWAIEALAKNAIDALAGRGGQLVLATTVLPEGHVRLRVADDGPGVPRELRRRIFEPGFSTKQSGWGVGLALARRIIEHGHGGSLSLAPSDRGATFDVIL